MATTTSKALLHQQKFYQRHPWVAAMVPPKRAIHTCILICCNKNLRNIRRSIRPTTIYRPRPHIASGSAGAGDRARRWPPPMANTHTPHLTEATRELPSPPEHTQGTVSASCTAPRARVAARRRGRGGGSERAAGHSSSSAAAEPTRPRARPTRCSAPRPPAGESSGGDRNSAPRIRREEESDELGGEREEFWFLF